MMNLNAVAKATVPVVLGVIVAGYVLWYGRNFKLIAEARNGYQGIR